MISRRQTKPWHLRQIGITGKFLSSINYGEGAVCLVHDTCVYSEHRGLIGRISKESQCTVNVQFRSAIDFTDANHGTMAASIINARKGNYKLAKDSYELNNNYQSKTADNKILVMGALPMLELLAEEQSASDILISQIGYILTNIKSLSKKPQNYQIELYNSVDVINLSGSAINWPGQIQSLCNGMNDFCNKMKGGKKLIVASIANNREELNRIGCSTLFPASVNTKKK